MSQKSVQSQYKLQIETSPSFSNFTKNLKRLISGGVAGAVARTCTAPFERIIILQQTQNPAYQGQSILSMLKNIATQEGPRGYFKGNWANVCRIFPFSSIELFSFEVYKKFVSGITNEKLSNNQLYLFSGALSGMTAATICYPFDILRTVFASQTNSNAYQGIFASWSKIIKTQGFFSLYRGLGATLIGITPFTSLKLTFFQLMKNYYYKDGRKHSDIANLSFGGLSGCMAVSITYPTDLIRRRLQYSIINGGPKLGYIETLKSIVKSDGIIGLYNGLPATYCKLIPAVAITFMINEKLKKSFEL